MDLNKPISLSGRGADKQVTATSASSRLSRGKDVYPTKTTINLMVDNTQSKANTTYTILAFVAAVVLIGIFCKFCVVDPLMSVATIDKQVQQQQQLLDELKAANADYNDVSSKYERYVVKDMTTDESAQTLRSDVFNLLDEHFDGVGQLLTVSLSKNTLTVTLLGADMSDVSGVVENLESDDRVEHVTVSTAQGKDTTATSATITVLFKDAADLATATNGGADSATSTSTSSSSAKGGN